MLALASRTDPAAPGDEVRGRPQWAAFSWLGRAPFGLVDDLMDELMDDLNALEPAPLLGKSRKSLR